jgi:cell division protein FtsI/penicillin-binding protein 2
MHRSRTIGSMRSILAALALLLSGCAPGTGVDPYATVDTTIAAAPSTIAVSEQTRLEAVEVAGQFYDAVLDRDGFAIAELGTDPPATVQADLDDWASAIGLIGGSFIVTKSQFTETTATITVRMSLDLIEVGPWSYETTVVLVGGSPWTSIWTTTALHPSLEPGDILRVDRAWLPRASILASDGRALAGVEPVKVVGVVPSRIENLEQLKAELARLGGIDPAVVDEELGRPAVQPDWFIPVGNLKLVVYASVGEEIEALPGVIVRDASERLPFRDRFASHLIGSVGPITADQLELLGFPYGPTDVVGQTGIEAEYESQLAGRPRTAIVRVNKFGRVVEDLFAIEALAPTDVLTTIDIDVQTAIEQAMRDTAFPTAIVIVESTTGQVRGIASGPAADGFDRAILGTYPPGSTFKVITATALLENGYSATTEVECPPGVILGGRSIQNAGDLDLGTISLTQAFAVSCNTAFAASTIDSLTPALLQDTTASFGFGTEPDLGVPSASSSFPTPGDIAELATAAIGQGRVLASPVHMASVAGAVAAGAWRPPTLIARPTRSEGIELERSAISSLRNMMRAVVTSGTGTNAAVPGVSVFGKTGSAEFGGGDDPDTHAWFIGYWDDLAIAVVVEGGGGGGRVAAPIAQRIIADLTR